MVSIGLCKHSECTHANECKRYIENVGEEFNFKVICNEDSNYKWLWKVEKAITKEE